MKNARILLRIIKEQIKWKFNLAPWWGGQLKKIVILMKQSLSKATGKINLIKQELDEILLDIEIVLNNRSLIHTEDNIQIPFLWATYSDSRRMSQ